MQLLFMLWIHNSAINIQFWMWLSGMRSKLVALSVELKNGRILLIIFDI